MNRIAIIADSAHDLPAGLVAGNTTHVVPLYVNVKDTSYLDGVTIDNPTLYALMQEGNELPRTSQPSPEDFRIAYEKALQQADEVICITLSSGISGTHQSACLARDMMDRPEVISVVDTQSASLGAGLFTITAHQLLQKGLPREEIVARLEQLKVHASFTVSVLKYLERGGRISKAQASLGTILDIKPILTISRDSDGKIESKTKIRTRKKALKYLIDMVKESVPQHYTGLLGICHAACQEDTLSMKNELATYFPHAQIVESEIGCAIGTHTGPGTVAVFYVE